MPCDVGDYIVSFEGKAAPCHKTAPKSLQDRPAGKPPTRNILAEPEVIAGIAINHLNADISHGQVFYPRGKRSRAGGSDSRPGAHEAQVIDPKTAPSKIHVT